VVRVIGSLPDRASVDQQASTTAGPLLLAAKGGESSPAPAVFPGQAADTAGLEASAGWLDIAWVVLWILGLAGIVIFERWEAIPFHLIWIAFALLYSFRIRNTKPTLWVLAAMIATTFAAIAFDVRRGAQPADELTEVPLMAAMFWVMMWHSHRRMAANAERVRVSDENERLLAAQRRFLQEASHQLRTPITIALGHSELLARNLADNQDKRDINVIVGELNRLRTLSERLLLIAASENPDFLRPEPVDLDLIARDIIRRWRPTADRSWQLGQLDEVTVYADRERLQLALDALLENAVQHTSAGGMISLSVYRARVADGKGGVDRTCARLVVSDSGTGIDPTDLASIFERFATGSGRAGRRGTGLGLALVRAVARGHGGDVRVRSVLGQGSTFELLLPVPGMPVPGTTVPGTTVPGTPVPGTPVPGTTVSGTTAQTPTTSMEADSRAR
jgi:signal transduction histidine kinase